MAGRVIFHWLYYGEQLLTAIRGWDNMTDIAVRTEALRQFEMCPGAFVNYPLENPSEFRHKIHFAEIKRD